MTTEELPEFLRVNWASIREQLLSGEYQPRVVLRKRIPKLPSGERALGIPSLLDRLIQQAIQQILSLRYDPKFSDGSFGFRPGRSCHKALHRSQEYVRAGHQIVVDIDLEKFFDKVHHDRLMGRLAKEIRDPELLKLIRRYLNAGILDQGLTLVPTEGVPQGGPLSPLLSNIYLDELDKELERRGHKFVRYADDCKIYVRTERSGRRVMSSISNFIEGRLKLKVNEHKSAVGSPIDRKFLGFVINVKSNSQLEISDFSLKRFKDRVRLLTQRNWRNSAYMVEKLSRYLRGWLGYYGLCEQRDLIDTLDKWIRRRLRVLHLKRWRSPRTRYREFQRLGMRQVDCKWITHTTKRYWYLSGSQAVNFTLNLAYFRSLGLFFMLDSYEL